MEQPMLVIISNLSKSRGSDVLRRGVVRSKRRSVAHQTRSNESSPSKHVTKGIQRLLDLAWERTLISYTLPYRRAAL